MHQAPMGVEFVADFQQLCTTQFTGSTNALCWKRTLPGDFSQVAACLAGAEDDLLTLVPDQLRTLPLDPAGMLAVESMLADFNALQERGLDPALNCIRDYQRDARGGPITTDVFSFHVDSAPCAIDTWLCTYLGAPSEGLCHHEADRHIDIPATRATVLSGHGGLDDAKFQAFLTDNAYDLHYRARPEARPFSFGVGHLWRIATHHPGCPVPPCIHRAPPSSAGGGVRLLLIS